MTADASRYSFGGHRPPLQGWCFGFRHFKADDLMRSYAMPEQKKIAVAAAFLALCVIWSSTWLAIKVGLRDLPPISFVAIRFAIAVAVLLAISVGRVGL